MVYHDSQTKGADSTKASSSYLHEANHLTRCQSGHGEADAFFSEDEEQNHVANRQSLFGCQHTRRKTASTATYHGSEDEIVVFSIIVHHKETAGSSHDHKRCCLSQCLDRTKKKIREGD